MIIIHFKIIIVTNEDFECCSTKDMHRHFGQFF